MADVVDSANSVKAYPGDLDNIRLVRERMKIHWTYLLSTVFAFIYVGVEIYIWNEAVEDPTRCFNHPVRELRADPNGMSGGNIAVVN